jgi:hypothetical protein
MRPHLFFERLGLLFGFNRTLLPATAAWRRW